MRRRGEAIGLGSSGEMGGIEMNLVWYDRNDLESGFEMGRGWVSQAARSPHPRLRSVKYHGSSFLFLGCSLHSSR